MKLLLGTGSARPRRRPLAPGRPGVTRTAGPVAEISRRKAECSVSGRLPTAPWAPPPRTGTMSCGVANSVTCPDARRPGRWSSSSPAVGWRRRADGRDIVTVRPTRSMPNRPRRPAKLSPCRCLSGNWRHEPQHHASLYPFRRNSHHGSAARRLEAESVVKRPGTSIDIGHPQRDRARTSLLLQDNPIARRRVH